MLDILQSHLLLFIISTRCHFPAVLLDKQTVSMQNMNEIIVKPRELPTRFDAREKWPDFIHPIQDQGDCAR